MEGNTVQLVFTTSIDVSWNDRDAAFLSPYTRIREGLLEKDVFAYHIKVLDDIIGFAMVRRWKSDAYFIWNFLILEEHRMKGYGTQALGILIDALRSLGAKTITTTRVASNLGAQKLFSRLGFVDTDTVLNDAVHETNMEWNENGNATKRFCSPSTDSLYLTDFDCSKGRCPRCHANNHCAVAYNTDPKDCWCMGVDVPPKLSIILLERYPSQACLCQTCLEDEIRRHPSHPDSNHHAKGTKHGKTENDSGI
jgi:RimJ/RimL family protein N-acetyltransferase